jgi:hypothetical protein
MLANAGCSATRKLFERGAKNRADAHGTKIILLVGRNARNAKTRFSVICFEGAAEIYVRYTFSTVMMTVGDFAGEG